MGAFSSTCSAAATPNIFLGILSWCTPRPHSIGEFWNCPMDGTSLVLSGLTDRGQGMRQPAFTFSRVRQKKRKNEALEKAIGSPSPRNIGHCLELALTGAV